jgi:hypothetical protein
MENNNGLTVLTGETQTRMFQMLSQKYALKLEMKGLKHSRGSVYAHVKRQYGFKGNKASVLAQLETLIADNA